MRVRGADAPWVENPCRAYSQSALCIHDSSNLWFSMPRFNQLCRWCNNLVFTMGKKRASLIAQLVKNLPAMQETPV